MDGDTVYVGIIWVKCILVNFWYSIRVQCRHNSPTNQMIWLTNIDEFFRLEFLVDIFWKRRSKMYLLGKQFRVVLRVQVRFRRLGRIQLETLADTVTENCGKG
jgi:hypothetical protein